MLALIDGDIVAFRASAAVQQNIDWGDGEDGVTVDPSAAAAAACHTVDAWARIARADKVHVAFTGRSNYRKTVLPSYKHNRSGSVKPKAYIYTVNELRDRYETTVVEGLEADDILGIAATNPKRAGEVIIVTLDKDLRTVPGLHLNPLKEKTPVLITPEQADYKWLTQTLTGDVTDGYSGCPKIGPKKAEKLLGSRGVASPATHWRIIEQAYRDAGLTRQDALTQARVARILRHGEYDKSTKSVLLWHPERPEPLALKDIT